MHIIISFSFLALTYPYPFEVESLHLEEKFHNIFLSWNDPHSSYDPIEFIVSCNSNADLVRNVHRHTTYTCEQTTFDEAKVISVETRVAIPGYKHHQVAFVKIIGIYKKFSFNCSIRNLFQLNKYLNYRYLKYLIRQKILL